MSEWVTVVCEKMEWIGDESNTQDGSQGVLRGTYRLVNRRDHLWLVYRTSLLLQFPTPTKNVRT